MSSSSTTDAAEEEETEAHPALDVSAEDYQEGLKDDAKVPGATPY